VKYRAGSLDQFGIGGAAKVGTLDRVQQVSAARVGFASGGSIGVGQKRAAAISTQPIKREFATQPRCEAIRDGEGLHGDDAIPAARTIERASTGRIPQHCREPQAGIVGKIRQCREAGAVLAVERRLGMAGEHRVAGCSPFLPRGGGIRAGPDAGIQIGNAAAPIPKIADGVHAASPLPRLNLARTRLFPPAGTPWPRRECFSPSGAGEKHSWIRGRLG